MRFKILLVMSLVISLVAESYGRSNKRSEKKSSSATEQVVEETSGADEDISFSDKIFNSFVSFYSEGIDEKLYLQSDKPYYSAGDKIWFKGYLLNAITHQFMTNTNFIYVELSTPDGTLVSRVKVRRESSGFNGYITLDPTMESGDYTLRAYTHWMMNQSSDYFFSKNIKIVSPIPVVEGESEEESLSRRARIKQEEAEAIATAREQMRRLEYDVQFFPEGGTFLKDVAQIVAFKAVAADGLSRYVKGMVYDSKGDEITKLEVTHKGMGIFSMLPVEGEQYYAVVSSLDGVERRFDLPAVDSVGVSLMVSNRGGRVYFKVGASDPELLEGSAIVVHSQGRIISVDSENKAVRYILEDQLSDGVSVISLVNPEGAVMAERVVFKRPSHLPQIDIESDAPNYHRRERVEVSVAMRDSEGNPARGEFGVAVSDGSTIVQDRASGDILSYLLLSSEIRGYVEDPGLYFAEGSESEAFNLDLLMRTQGWRRFDLTDILQGRVAKRSIPYEVEGLISGSAEGFFGNEAKEAQLSVICAQTNYMEYIPLTTSNKFALVGVDLPDSATYVLQARGRKGGNLITLKVDPELFPQAQESIVDRAFEEYIPQAFVNQSQDKFYYDGGMNMIDIEAVEVTANKVSHQTSSAFATRGTSRADLEMMSGMPMEMLLQMYPGMTVSTDGVMYRDASDYALFYVNGFEYEYLDVTMFTADDIEQIEFFYGMNAILYSNADGGVFEITLRDDYVDRSARPQNIAFVNKLGYQRAAEYYQPKYDNPTVKEMSPPDYRTTLFWSGALTPDEDGVITFDFFTADKATTYDVVVEGVTEGGEICRGSAKVERTLRN